MAKVDDSSDLFPTNSFPMEVNPALQRRQHWDEVLLGFNRSPPSISRHPIQEVTGKRLDSLPTRANGIPG